MKILKFMINFWNKVEYLWRILIIIFFIPCNRWIIWLSRIKLCWVVFKNLKKKIFAKGLDHTILTGSCGPTLILMVHEINKKSGSLGLKNRFSSQFSIFMVRPPGSIWFWKPCSTLAHNSIFLKSNFKTRT